MKFIDKLNTFSGETIYKTDGVEVISIRGQKYRYLVDIFDMRFFVFSEVEATAYEIIDFVVKNNPNSGFYLLRTIIAESSKLGERRGREELQTQIQKLLNL